LVLVWLLLGSSAGCTLPAHVKGTSWVDALRSGTAVGPNMVLIETALIERPVGDPYITRELWQDADELFVDFDKQEALHANGLRVGQIIGAPSAGFQTLLLSPRFCRNPSRLMVPSGKTVTQYLGPVLPHSSFDVVLGDTRTGLEVDKAGFAFDVQATLTRDGRTRLVFTPKVETAENALPFRASPEEGSWVLQVERPSRKFAPLGWEVTLAPGQYLVVGSLSDKAGTFGSAALVQEDDETAVQRLFVIRTNRSGGRESDLVGSEGSAGDRAAPLAVQASMSADRGKSR
jgi:hypothetical protein